MRKLLLSVILVAVATVSCQREPSVVAPPAEQNVEFATSEYAISEEEALARLDMELSSIYGETTRSSQRRVRHIEPLRYSDISSPTRAANADIDELLYIVEFEDNQGSAILGADSRVEPVFAILEDGTITAENFQDAAAGKNMDDIATFLAGCIANEAIEQASFIPIEPEPIVPGFQLSYWEYDTVAIEYRHAMLMTKWGQQSFYDDSCFYIDGRNHPAGCGTIAAAQLVLYNTYPNAYNISIGNETFNRSILNMARYGYTIPSSMTSIVRGEVARYVARTADHILKWEYSNCSSITDIKNYLETIIGYSYTSIVADYNGIFETEMRDNIYIAGKPLVITADYDYMGQGHLWIIDGYYYDNVDWYWCTKEGNKIISREYIKTTESKKVHANFGWYGRCDGYYAYSIFDVSEPLDSEDIDTSVGDLIGTQPINLQYDMKILVYNF